MLTRRDIGVLMVLAVLAAATALMQSYRAPPLPSHDRAIRLTISQHIVAFQRRDTQAAWALASPNLQARFTSPNGYMAMAEAHYPALFEAQNFDFNARAKRLGQYKQTRVQNLFLTDQRGKGYWVAFTMQKQPDGSWKIAGCQLRETKALNI